MRVAPNFFDTSTTLRRCDIAFLPFKFALCTDSADRETYKTAAAMFKQTLLDQNLADVYGGRHLYWLPKLKAAALVLTLVQQAQNDEDERVVRLASIDRGLLQEVSDGDVDILLTHLRDVVSMDLTGCVELSNAALALCGKRARALKVRGGIRTHA
jgi:hypothetical protein